MVARVIDMPDLEACVLSDGREGFRLVSTWRYTWRIDRVWRRLTIPRGFEHDGASVPRLLWTCLGLTPSGLISPAAIVHDALYMHGGLLPKGWLHERPAGVSGWTDIGPLAPYTRAEADRMFARLMREAGVPKLRRRLAYLGVRLGGYFAWAEAG